MERKWRIVNVFFPTTNCVYVTSRKGLKINGKEKTHSEDIQIEHVVTEWNSFQFQRNR